jgi:hypothetical protein
MGALSGRTWSGETRYEWLLAMALKQSSDPATPSRLSGILRKIVLGLFVTVGIFTVAAGAYLNVEYASTMPRFPQPRVGRIFKVVVNHGTTVYINKRDVDKLNFVDLYLGLGFGFCLLVVCLLRIRKRRLLTSRWW